MFRDGKRGRSTSSDHHTHATRPAPTISSMEFTVPGPVTNGGFRRMLSPSYRITSVLGYISAFFAEPVLCYAVGSLVTAHNSGSWAKHSRVYLNTLLFTNRSQSDHNKTERKMEFECLPLNQKRRFPNCRWECVFDNDGWPKSLAYGIPYFGEMFNEIMSDRMYQRCRKPDVRTSYLHSYTDIITLWSLGKTEHTITPSCSRHAVDNHGQKEFTTSSESHHRNTRSLRAKYSADTSESELPY
ncbi:hypothetical protein BT96DRAFT_997299 [Gymnopus androsaceus JB14]|uniref:Uncharacterized protein n=1 Tax=Gymnopus androsaceus JB14 TaxID=1447944 RepID=A0A6A4HDT7_9AGAR|nr:hypothetical protein BT96DRAFT_997299 [Gymnopus androsaceus JB14]